MTDFQPPNIPATDAARKLADARHVPLGAIPRDRGKTITQPMVRAYLKEHKGDLPTAAAVGAEIAAAASSGAPVPAPTPAAPPPGGPGTVTPETLAQVRGAVGAEPPAVGAVPPAKAKPEPWRAKGLGAARDVAVGDTVLIDGRRPGVVEGFEPTAGGERVLVKSEAHPVGDDSEHLTIAYPPARLVKVRRG